MYVSCVLGDKLRIIMSSIMRWRRGEIGLVIDGLLSTALHERAILADRRLPTDDQNPIEMTDGPNGRLQQVRQSSFKTIKINILNLGQRPRPRRLPRQRFSGVLGMCRREARSEGSVQQTCESMDKHRVQGASVGRPGHLPRSPYPSRMRSVDPATVHERRLSLPQEICSVSLRRLRMPEGILTAKQKSAEGVVGHVVGKASEALQTERWRQQIGRAGNGG